MNIKNINNFETNYNFFLLIKLKYYQFFETNKMDACNKKTTDQLKKQQFPEKL